MSDAPQRNDATRLDNLSPGEELRPEFPVVPGEMERPAQADRPTAHVIPFQPDQIRAHKQTINGLLNSAFVQEASAGSPALAEEDYREAIKVADAVGSDWINEQFISGGREFSGTLTNYEKLQRDFRTDVDALPGPTRRKVNQALFEFWNAEAKDGPGVWKNKELVDRVASTMPPEMREKFMKFGEIDAFQENLRELNRDLLDLSDAPMKTRLLLARHLAGRDDIEGSREVLNDMLRLRPELAHSDAFYAAFENPKMLTGVKWSGEGAYKPPQQGDPLKALRDLFRNFDDSTGDSGKEQPRKQPI